MLVNHRKTENITNVYISFIYFVYIYKCAELKLYNVTLSIQYIVIIGYIDLDLENNKECLFKAL